MSGKECTSCGGLENFGFERIQATSLTDVGDGKSYDPLGC